jgi:SAM-dependent methyltransferase
VATAAPAQLPPGLERALPLLAPKVRAIAERDGAPRGYLDLLGDLTPRSPGPLQDLMFTSIVPRIYERWWRPALGRAMKGVFGPGMAEERRIARLLLGLTPGDGVLDVACGTGNFTRDFAKAVGSEGLVVGIDVSVTMLDRAAGDTEKAALEHVAYVRGDAQELPFRDHSFDAVCCFAALHLMTNPMRALDRMTAVLNPGGRLALFTSVRGRSAPLRTAESLVQARGGAWMFERDELVEALRARGYGEIRQRLTGVTQFLGARLEP